MRLDVGSLTGFLNGWDISKLNGILNYNGSFVLNGLGSTADNV